MITKIEKQQGAYEKQNMLKPLKQWKKTAIMLKQVINGADYMKKIEEMKKNIKEKEEERKCLQEYLTYRKKRMEEIQTRFDFEVPDYIIDEIIDREDESIKNNIYMLVNLAVVNNRITKEQGEEIKNKVKTKKI